MKSLMELEPGDCRWPVDERDGQTFFCGEPVTRPRCSYCEPHRDRAYEPDSALNLNPEQLDALSDRLDGRPWNPRFGRRASHSQDLVARIRSSETNPNYVRAAMRDGSFE